MVGGFDERREAETFGRTFELVDWELVWSNQDPFPVSIPLDRIVGSK